MSGAECTYCGCDVTVHDPVSVREWESGRDGESSEGDGEELPFCNYGCLAAYVEEAGLALGTTCSVEP